MNAYPAARRRIRNISDKKLARLRRAFKEDPQSETYKAILDETIIRKNRGK